MKLYAIVIFCVISFTVQKQTPKLVGNYRVEFDKKYAFLTYKVAFNDSIYAITLQDARTSKGKINYSKFRASFKEHTTNNPVEIDNREINKDTIKFVTKSKKNSEMVVSRGILIKIN